MPELLEVAVFWPGDEEPSHEEQQKIFHEVNGLHGEMRLVKAELWHTQDAVRAKAEVENIALKYSETARFIYARLLRQLLDNGINPDEISLESILGTELRKGPDDDEYIKAIPTTEH